MINKIKNYLGSKLLNPNKILLNIECTEFEIDNWEVSKFIVKKIIPIVGLHLYPLNELMLMVSAVCRFRPDYIFEWGTGVGKSARIFSESANFLNIDTKIYSSDLPASSNHPDHPGKLIAKYAKRESQIIFLIGDGLNNSLKIYKNLNKKVSTLFFLDGDHDYKSVKKELEMLISCIEKPKILIHDTFFQSKDSNYNLGPHKAIEEILKHNMKYNFRKIETKTGLPGMCLLY